MRQRSANSGPFANHTLSAQHHQNSPCCRSPQIGAHQQQTRSSTQSACNSHSSLCHSDPLSDVHTASTCSDLVTSGTFTTGLTLPTPRLQYVSPDPLTALKDFSFELHMHVSLHESRIHFANYRDFRTCGVLDRSCHTQWRQCNIKTFYCPFLHSVKFGSSEFYPIYSSS